MQRSAAALQVVVAVPDRRVADRMAAVLLSERLCACAQTVGPIQSRYRWRGKVESAREYLLVLKTRPALFAAVARTVRALHPYQVPEIVALPLAAVDAPYLAWLRAETRSSRAPAAPRGATPERRTRRRVP